MTTTNGVIEPIEAGWQELTALVESLGPAGLTLSDADLQRPYNQYQPNDPREASDNRPVVDWVSGNTWEHYAEHISWINQLVKDSSASR